jgi:AraC family transcriptional regulator
MEYREETVDRKPFVGILHRGAYKDIGATWDKLFQVAGPMGWMGPDTTMAALYLDNPYEVPEADLRSYAAINKPAGFAKHADFENVDIGGGNYVIGRFIGPYSGLGDAWSEIVHHTSDDRWRRNGDVFEVYVHHDEANPSHCVTDLYVPVK